MPRPRVRAGLPLNTIRPEVDVKPRWRDISATRLLSIVKSSVDMKWAAFVQVKKFRKLTATNGQTVYRSESLTVKPLTPPDRIHFFTIRARNPAYTGPLSKCPALIFGCTCERWAYHYEYAMFYYGAAQLLRSNGEFPSQTNPSLRLGGCKHACRALEVLIARGL